jgi:lipoate---protein ligase
VVQYWRYIEENDVSAHYGLATDEILMHPYVGDSISAHQATLRLYNYADHCALVGRFQNINAELDLESCIRQNIHFGRRQTGGGAIIMGRDQLGLCITCSSKTFSWTNVRDLCYLFSRPVIDALTKLGINAEFRAKNDLEVDGRKMAGLGVYIDPYGAIQFHLSLLLDLDILKMLSILQIPIQKYSDKRKVSAVSQRMATVSGEIRRAISHGEIRALICDSFASHFGVNMNPATITSDEKVEIERLIKNKYTSENWIYQQSPQSDLTGMSLIKTQAGLLRIYIGLKGEVIKSVLITGDFIEHELVFKQIEAELKWSPMDKECILNTVSKVLGRLSSDTQDRNGTQDRNDTHNGVYITNSLPLWRGKARRAQGEENQPPANQNPVSAEALANAIFLAAQKAYNTNQHTYKGTCYYPKREKTATVNNPTI